MANFTSKLRLLHAIAMALWALLLIPTLLWWRDSVLWVATMSLYANFVGHFASWQAARAGEKVDKQQNE